MKKIWYYSPSYKRKGKTSVEKLVPLVVFCVHSFEYEEYVKEYGKNRVKLLRDDARGNMAKVRNNILEISKENNDDICVMMDDDVKSVWYYENMEKFVVGIEKINEKIESLGSITEDLWWCLYGINLQSDPKFYREYTPYSFHSPVLWPFTCILMDNLWEVRYDERLWLNEDYDLFIQMCYRDGVVVRYNKRHYSCGHIKDEGWCGAYRTLEREKKQADIMKRKWWKVVKYNFKKSTNPIVKIPYRWI